MCGITGIYYFDKDKKVSTSILEKMTHSLIHRGPDFQDIYINSNCGLGHTRLSIIDLDSRANQPFKSNISNSVICFNGTIYNYKDLNSNFNLKDIVTTSDTETLIKILDQKNLEALELIEGMFAFSYLDEKNNLLLARDPFGIKPLYYYSDDEKIIFGSEIKAILQFPDINKEISNENIDQYLSFGFIGSPNTPFKHIKQIKPGHYIKADSNGYEEFRYFELDLKTEKNKINYLSELERLISDTTKLHTVSDVKYTSFLSGGKDSSSLAIAINEHDKNVNFTTYSFDNNKFDESKDAIAVSKLLNTNCHIIKDKKADLELLRKLAFINDDLICDPSLIPTYFLCQETAKEYKLALSADGGDEIFWGYHTHKATLLVKYLFFPLNYLIQIILSFLAMITPQTNSRYSLKDKFYRFSQFLTLKFPQYHINWRRFIFNNEKNKLYNHKLAGLKSNSHFLLEPIPYKEFLKVISYIDFRYYLESNLLKKMDRMSMASSLEVRVPFISKTFLNNILKFPFNIRFSILELKRLLNAYIKKHLNEEIVNKEKSGFSPPVADYLDENQIYTLFIETPDNHRFFEYIKKNELLTYLKESKNLNYLGILSLVNFKFWLDHYEDNFSKS